ncbi:NADPH-dependent 7-cyano-7-deazaguanine reductase, partial [Sutterella wadsworthensis]
ESKSLKLYQGSFAQTRFAGGAEEVAAILKRDLSNAAGAPVEVAVNTLDTWTPTIDDLPGELLEEAFPDVSITDFEVNPELLEKAPAAIDTDVKDNIRAAVWRTNLFRSLCPVTGQPDYASVSVALTGEAVDPRSLLKYLVSYRAHRGFHEQCVEQIFHDLRSRFTFTSLEVQACFTRRGGIDINPYRSMGPKMPEFVIREGRQ